MRKKMISLVKVLLATMMLASCDSCADDPYVDITYTVTCSESLLEYATPRISYRGNGKSIEMEIPKADWKETSQTTVSNRIIVGGDTIQTSNKIKEYAYHVNYELSSAADDELTVVFTPKDGIPSDKVSALNFYHNLSAVVEVGDDDGHAHHYPFQGENTVINIGGGVEGLTLFEIVNGYKDYRGFHVESNGSCTEK